MNIQTLLESKTFVKENGAITFPTPKRLVQPFLDIVQDAEYSVKTAEAVTNQEQESNVLNTAYPKVLVEGKMSWSEIKDFNPTIGMIYHLNCQRPMIKVYTGLEVKACMNLTIFNAEHVFQTDLLGNYTDAYKKLDEYMKGQRDTVEKYIEIYQDLVETYLGFEELKELLGGILLQSTRNNMVSTVTKGVKLLYDSNSAYYIGEGERYSCTKWNLYQSMTAALGNADIAEKPMKTINLSKMLEIN